MAHEPLMKPRVTILMLTSLDGRLHPSRWTSSPDGARSDWSRIYEALHETLAPDAWMVGRVTMAEMSKSGPHPPAEPRPVTRPLHVAGAAPGHYAVAIDPSGKLHFQGGRVGGDPVIVLLGRDVPDSHLAELAEDGVSYIVAEDAAVDLAEMLDALARHFGIRHLLLEGGARTNGAFLAAGVVEEIGLVLAPAVDGGEDVESIVHYPGGLAGKIRLSLKSAEPLGHGALHLRYAVSGPTG